MRRVISWFVVTVGVFVFGMAIHMNGFSIAKKSEQHACTGYTIIEAGKGITCDGDTIRLIRRNGFYEVERSNAEASVAMNK